MGMKYQGFRSLLYLKFIHEKAYSVEAVCSKMGLPPQTFYKYMSGQSTFPPDLIGKLYNATGEPAFLNFILNDTDQMLAPRQRPEAGKSVLEETLEVASATGDLAQKVQKALADGYVDKFEAARIIKSINNVHKELEDLAQKVKEG